VAASFTVVNSEGQAMPTHCGPPSSVNENAVRKWSSVGV